MNKVKTLNIEGGQNTIIELGQITYKGGSARVYLPKKICSLLDLNRNTSKKLVFFYDVSSGLLCCFTNKEIENRVKSEILELRKRAAQFISSNKQVEAPQLETSTYTVGESRDR